MNLLPLGQQLQARLLQLFLPYPQFLHNLQLLLKQDALEPDFFGTRDPAILIRRDQIRAPLHTAFALVLRNVQQADGTGAEKAVMDMLTHALVIHAPRLLNLPHQLQRRPRLQRHQLLQLQQLQPQQPQP